MGGGGEDRTESATPKKRGEARKRGQVPKSTDLSSIVVLLGLVIALRKMGGSSTAVVRNYTVNTLAHLDDTSLTVAVVMHRGAEFFLVMVHAIWPLMATAMLLGILVNVAQTGLLLSTEALKPSFNKLNPITGAKRFVSATALVNLVKSLYKIGLIGYIAYVTIRGNYAQLILMTRLDLVQAIGLVGDVVYTMSLRVTVTMFVLSALDYFYQRYSTEKSLRMTKEEVKQEHKQSEGNPQMRGRIRARQKQMARKRMMSEVPTADVVITNPTHFAIALKYDVEKSSAPIVVAKGMDLMALKIRELAQMNDVPIVENPPLARLLYKEVDLGREIPGDLYEAVAEVLAFVFQINQKRRERGASPFARTAR